MLTACSLSPNLSPLRPLPSGKVQLHTNLTIVLYSGQPKLPGAIFSPLREPACSMHIADGILPASVCIAAQIVAWSGVSLAGRKLEPQEVSKMGLLASAAFVSSLVQFPIAATSVHLGLFGLLGVLLGRRSFPVVFAALLFQTLLFQHGGLLSLGVNALNMGAGALAGWAIWKIAALPEGLRAFLAGFVGALLPALLMAAEFAAVDYGRGLYFLVALYTPVAAVEGAITMAAVVFFRRTRPEVLSGVAA